MWLRQGLTSSAQVAPKMRADALAEEGWLAWAQGDWQEAMSLAEEGLAIARGLGEKWRMADALNTLGAVAAAQEQYEQAAEFYQESLTLHQDLGDRSGMGRRDRSRCWINNRCDKRNVVWKRKFRPSGDCRSSWRGGWRIVRRPLAIRRWATLPFDRVRN